VGDQFTPAQAPLLEHVFGLFYFSINAGSLLSTIFTPILREYVAVWLAFGVPAVLLAVAMFIFWLGRKNYRVVPPSGSVMSDAFKVLKV
jgi:dipeptide/tripeptide permease